MSAYRHHRAHAPGPAIVLVPVPVAGSNKEARRLPPPPYPPGQREAWRPQRAIPTKAERLGQFLDRIARQNQAVREMLKLRPEARC